MKTYFHHFREAVQSCSVGLGVTFKHLFNRAVTVQYPDERMELAKVWKGRHRLYLDKCTGCQACVRACPPGCITLEIERLKGQKKKIRIDRFTVNLNTCMFCGFCQAACPTSSLELQPEYETLTFTEKRSLILNLLKEQKYSPGYDPDAVEEEKPKVEKVVKPPEPDAVDAAPPEKNKASGESGAAAKTKSPDKQLKQTGETTRPEQDSGKTADEGFKKSDKSSGGEPAGGTTGE